MILEEKLDPEVINKMTDEEKIELARQAYAEYLHFAHEVSDKQKHVLNKALQIIKEKKINEVRNYIKSNFPD